MASFPASSHRCSGSWAPSGSTCIWILRESAQGPLSCSRGLLPLDRPRCPPRTPGVPGSLAFDAWVPQDPSGSQGTCRALTVHARGKQRQEQQEQRGCQEPHAGRRARREWGLGEGALPRCGGREMLPGSALLARARLSSRLLSRPLRPSPVGRCLRLSLRALRSVLGSALAPQPPSARPGRF